MHNEMSSLVFLQYLTTVFDNIEDGIILISVEPADVFRLLLANGAFYRQSGYSKSDVGRQVKELVTAAGYEKLSARYREVATSREPLEYTGTYTLPNGEATLRTKFIPILNAVGETIQIAAIVHDETELHHLRGKLHDTTDALTTISQGLQTEVA